jgi:hypothetical protein
MAAKTAAATPTQTITIINQAALPPPFVAQMETAISGQSRAVRQHWGTPIVTFGPGGWAVTIQADLDADGEQDGEHWSGPDGIPAGDVAAGDGTLQSRELNGSFYADHEIIEMLVDPTGARTIGGVLAEPCDPVENLSYGVVGDNVVLSDFAYPSWFQAGAAGPYDYLGAVAQPLDISHGTAPN